AGRAGALSPDLPLGFDLGSDALQIVQVQPSAQPGLVRLTLQNLSPQRQLVRWPEGWCAHRELPDEPVASCAPPAADDLLLPWQLGSWCVSPRDRRTDR
ncbi:MAG: hypothetical protein RLZZ106_856, partial [Cyanobacteriota bacterium]